MAQKKMAIYITSDVIRMCELVKSGSNLTVSRLFETKTPLNSVDDGLIVDVEQVAAAIRSAFQENLIKKAHIVFTIYSRKIAAKEIELPYIKQENKIGEMIVSNVDDYFPMNNMQDYLTPYRILDTVEMEGRKFNKIVVFAVQKELVASYFELGKALKMPVVSIDYQVNSLNNLMKKQIKSGIHLMLQVDSDATHVTIMNGQAQLFRRSVPHGSDALIQAFAADKGMEAEEAETILKNQMLLEENLDPEEYNELVRDFASAITRVVEFYTTKNPELLIEHAKMYGVGACLSGFGNALGRALGVELETISSLNGVQIKKKNIHELSEEQLSSYLPNIGALIDPLHLKLEEEGKKKGSGYGIFIFLIVVSVLSVSGFSGFLYYNNSQLEGEKQTLETIVAELAVAENLYGEYEAVKADYDTIAAFHSATMSRTETLYHFILELEKVVPVGIGLIDLSVNEGMVSANGFSAGKEPIAYLIMELKKMPFVTSIRVSSMNDTGEDALAVITNFNISFQLLSLEEAETVERLVSESDGTTEEAVASEGEAGATDTIGIEETGEVDEDDLSGITGTEVQEEEEEMTEQEGEAQ